MQASVSGRSVRRYSKAVLEGASVDAAVGIEADVRSDEVIEVTEVLHDSLVLGLGHAHLGLAALLMLDGDGVDRLGGGHASAFEGEAERLGPEHQAVRHTAGTRTDVAKIRETLVVARVEVRQDLGILGRVDGDPDLRSTLVHDHQIQLVPAHRSSPR